MKTLPFLFQKLWLQRRRARPVRVMHALVVSGIALSVAALTVALAITAGFERDYKKALLDFNAHIVIGPETAEGLSEETLRKAVPDLESVMPFLYREALLVRKGVIKGVVLKGIAPNAQIQTPDKGNIVLGKTLAKALDVQPGQEVKLLIPKGGAITAQNAVRLKVGGEFQSGLHELDANFAWVDLTQLQKWFDLAPKTFGYELRLHDPDAAPEAVAALKKRLGPLAAVQDWQELNRPIFEALVLEKWVFRILMGLMVLVSALNLIGAILLAIFRNKRTIAILKALGLKDGHVRRLFALQGMALGGVGILLGLSLGIGLVVLTHRTGLIPLDPSIYFLEKLPVDLNPKTIVIIALFSFFLVGGASRWAAGRAVQLPIREGLHGPG